MVPVSFIDHKFTSISSLRNKGGFDFFLIKYSSGNPYEHDFLPSPKQIKITWGSAFLNGLFRLLNFYSFNKKNDLMFVSLPNHKLPIP